MSKPLKPKRGTTAENNAYIGEAYEITLDTDKKTIVVRDGATAGGFPLAKEADLTSFKTAQATKDAAQDTAITAAQTAANSRISNASIDGLDLVLTYGDGSTKRVQLPAGKSVGDLWMGFDSKSKPANVQLYAGQLLSRSAYEVHSAFVLGGNRTVLSESEWQAQVTANGFCPFYSSGDGSTTYRMPLIKGVHPEFVAALAEAGQYKEAGLPNITGTLGISNGSAGVSGAFAKTTTADWNLSGGGSTVLVYGSFDASRSNTIYGNSDTVQPPSVTCVLGEYVVGSVAVIGEADAESLLASVTRLESSVGALQNGVGRTSAYVIETWSSGTSWYRKWSDGWIEQGGVAGVASSESRTVTLHKAFKNTNYTLHFTPFGTSQNGIMYMPYWNATKTTTSFTTAVWNDMGKIWTACGY